MRPLDPLVAEGPIRRPANSREAARQRLHVGDNRGAATRQRVEHSLVTAAPGRRWGSPGLRRRMRLGFIGLGLMAIAVALGLGAPMAGLGKLKSGLQNLAMNAGLTVHKITVTGRHDTSREDLLAALGVNQGDPILGIDTEAARERLERLGWVRTASVTRVLPDTLQVVLVERRPLAVWQTNGRHMLVDRDGHVISGQGRNTAGLPLVVGEGAPARAAELLSVIALEPRLAALVVAAVRVGDRRWDIRLENGITVRLPEIGYEAAWRRLATLERSHGLTGRAIDAVDMRLADRLVIHMLEDAIKSRLGPAKNT